MKRLAAIPVAVAATLALSAGTADANAYTADADCGGLTVDMPRAEDGTTVTVTRNGATVRTVRNETFGAPVRFRVPSPDQTQPQTWRVTVVGYNGAAPAYVETVPACVAPTTSASPATTSSTVTPTTASPSPSTVPKTTVVAVTTPPVPSTTVVTTVITPPRTPAPTTPPPPTYVLPETGRPDWLEALGFVAGAMLAVGTFLVLVRRRPGGAS